MSFDIWKALKQINSGCEVILPRCNSSEIKPSEVISKIDLTQDVLIIEENLWTIDLTLDKPDEDEEYDSSPDSPRLVIVEENEEFPERCESPVENPIENEEFSNESDSPMKEIGQRNEYTCQEKQPGLLKIVKVPSEEKLSDISSDDDDDDDDDDYSNGYIHSSKVKHRESLYIPNERDINKKKEVLDRFKKKMPRGSSHKPTHALFKQKYKISPRRRKPRSEMKPEIYPYKRPHKLKVPPKFIPDHNREKIQTNDEMVLKNGENKCNKNLMKIQAYEHGLPSLEEVTEENNLNSNVPSEKNAVILVDERNETEFSELSSSNPEVTKDIDINSKESSCKENIEDNNNNKPVSNEAKVCQINSEIIENSEVKPVAPCKGNIQIECDIGPICNELPGASLSSVKIVESIDVNPESRAESTQIQKETRQVCNEPSKTLPSNSTTVESNPEISMQNLGDTAPVPDKLSEPTPLNTKTSNISDKIVSQHNERKTSTSSTDQNKPSNDVNPIATWEKGIQIPDDTAPVYDKLPEPTPLNTNTSKISGEIVSQHNERKTSTSSTDLNKPGGTFITGGIEITWQAKTNETIFDSPSKQDQIRVKPMEKLLSPSKIWEWHESSTKPVNEKPVDTSTFTKPVNTSTFTKPVNALTKPVIKDLTKLIKFYSAKLNGILADRVFYDSLDEEGQKIKLIEFNNDYGKLIKIISSECHETVDFIKILPNIVDEALLLFKTNNDTLRENFRAILLNFVTLEVQMDQKINWPQIVNQLFSKHNSRPAKRKSSNNKESTSHPKTSKQTSSTSQLHPQPPPYGSSLLKQLGLICNSSQEQQQHPPSFHRIRTTLSQAQQQRYPLTFQQIPASYHHHQQQQYQSALQQTPASSQQQQQQPFLIRTQQMTQHSEYGAVVPQQLRNLISSQDRNISPRTLLPTGCSPPAANTPPSLSPHLPVEFEQQASLSNTANPFVFSKSNQPRHATDMESITMLRHTTNINGARNTSSRQITNVNGMGNATVSNHIRNMNGMGNATVSNHIRNMNSMENSTMPSHNRSMHHLMNATAPNQISTVIGVGDTMMSSQITNMNITGNATLSNHIRNTYDMGSATVANLITNVNSTGNATMSNQIINMNSIGNATLSSRNRNMMASGTVSSPITNVNSTGNATMSNQITNVNSRFRNVMVSATALNQIKNMVGVENTTLSSPAIGAENATGSSHTTNVINVLYNNNNLYNDTQNGVQGGRYESDDIFFRNLFEPN